MKKVILTIAIIAVPFLGTAQEGNDKANTVINTTIKTEVIVKKKVEPISVNPLEQSNLNIKKSIDLISVKAYIKSLQLKRKESLMS
jgi:uncharacterized protein (UPF0210 family)